MLEVDEAEDVELVLDEVLGESDDVQVESDKPLEISEVHVEDVAPEVGLEAEELSRGLDVGADVPDVEPELCVVSALDVPEEEAEDAPGEPDSAQADEVGVELVGQVDAVVDESTPPLASDVPPPSEEPFPPPAPPASLKQPTSNSAAIQLLLARTQPIR